MTSARLAAYRVLSEVALGTDLPVAHTRHRDILPDDRERALVTELTNGTLRWLAALDHIIASVSARPLAKLDVEVLQVLRLGAYQLVHLDRIPASAAVDQAVTLVRQIGKASARGFVNAVLRKIARLGGDHRLPTIPTATASRHEIISYLSITCSHPEWLAERWLSRLGRDSAMARVRFNNQIPALTLQVNRLRIAPTALAQQLNTHGVQTEPTRFASHGLAVVSGNPLRTPLAQRGLFEVQDEASQLVAELAGARRGERVLDGCAAPGGKTIALATGVGSTGTVVAADLRPARVRLLRATVQRFGSQNVPIVRHDLRHPPFLDAFDCVLVDAPCSGLGTIRRDPDIRWRRTPVDLAHYADAQRALLAQAAKTVRPGGRLVYATCSSEPEENEEVVEAFLADHPSYEPIHPERVGAISPGLGAVLNADGNLSTSPEAHALESFFGVILLRQPKGARLSP